MALVVALNEGKRTLRASERTQLGALVAESSLPSRPKGVRFLAGRKRGVVEKGDDGKAREGEGGEWKDRAKRRYPSFAEGHFGGYVRVCEMKLPVCEINDDEVTAEKTQYPGERGFLKQAFLPPLACMRIIAAKRRTPFSPPSSSSSVSRGCVGVGVGSAFAEGGPWLAAGKEMPRETMRTTD